MSRFRAVVTMTYEVEVEAASTLWVPEHAVARARDTLPTEVRVSHVEEIPKTNDEVMS